MRQKTIQMFFLALFAITVTSAQEPSAADDAAQLHRAQKALTRVIVHDIFSPPVASRIYLYANMAAYEAMIPSQARYRSLRHSVPSFPQVHYPAEKKLHYGLSAVYALLKTARLFVFSEAMLEDSLRRILASYDKLPSGVYRNSIAFAQQIADSIGKWSLQDQYKETRKMNRYSFIKSEGKWLPTPPGYMAAVEPYWKRMRPIGLDSAGECKPPPPPAFSKEKQTGFYEQAYEVYKTCNTHSPEQKNIALFWDCNPFFLNTQGHLNFATKKLSPGGHWISIAGIAARKTKSNLATTSAAYLLTSIAVYDGFISCWDEKYRSNLIRPETYINGVIDEYWRPLLQTPPFPEYPSGHSVISTAAAVVLTSLFGDTFSFEDSTETDYGLPVRSFGSFQQAADEAAISRLYGGIHYRAAIENGQEQGRRVGKKILSRIKLLP
jgi:hypothetical protein